MNQIIILIITALFFYSSTVYFPSFSNSTVYYLISGGWILLLLSVFDDFFKKFKLIPYLTYIIIPIVASIIFSAQEINISFGSLKFFEFFFLSCLSLYISVNTKLKINSSELSMTFSETIIRLTVFVLILAFVQFVFFDIEAFAYLNSFGFEELVILSFIGLFPTPILTNVFIHKKNRIEGISFFTINNILVILVLILAFLGFAGKNEVAVSLLISVCLSIPLYFLFRIYRRVVNKEFMLFFIALFVTLYFSGLLNSHIEYFILFFVLGSLVQTERGMFAQIKLYSKRYTKIVVLVFSVIYFLQLPIIIDHYVLATLIFLFNLVVAFLAKKFIVVFLEKKKFSVIRVTGLQGFLGLFVIQFFYMNGLISGAHFHTFIFFTIFQIICGSAILQFFWSIYIRDKQNETKAIYEMEQEDVYFRQLPDSLNHTSLKYNLNQLTTKFKDLSVDFVETILGITIDNGNQFINELYVRFQMTGEKLTKELSYIVNNDKEALKNKVRENRSYLSTEYRKLVSNDLSIENKEAEFLSINSEYLKNIQEIIKQLTEIEVPQNEYNIESQEGDLLWVQFFKFIKRRYMRLIKLVSSRFSLKRRINLKNIVLYHYYDKFPFINKLFVNKVLYQNFLIIKKSYLLFKEMDEYFVKLLDFIEQNHSEEIFEEQLPFFVKEIEKEINEEYEVIQNDFTQFVEYDSDLLKRGINTVLAGSFNDFLITGTFEEVFKKRRPSKSFLHFNEHFEEITHLTSNWVQLNLSKIGHLEMELEVIRLQGKVRKIVNISLDKLTEQINIYIRAIILSTDAFRWQLIESIEKDVKENVIIDEKYINDIKRKFLYQLKINTQKSIESLKDSKKLSGFVTDLIQKIHTLILEVPSTFKIGLSQQQEITDTMYPKHVTIEKAPFRQITRSFLEIEVTRSLTELNGQMAVALDNLIQIFTDVSDEFGDQIETFLETKNFEELSHKEKETKVKEILESFNRQFIDSVEYTDSIVTNIKTIVIREIIEKIQKIRQITIEATDKTLRESIDTYSGDDHMSTEIISYQLKNQVTSFREQFIDKFKLLSNKYKLLKEKIVIDPNLQEEIDAKHINFSSVIDKLPYVYQKLMSLEPIEIQDFLKGRKKQIDQFKAVLQNWKSGKWSHVSIIGQLGNGKSSFLNYLTKYVVNDEIVYRVKVKPGMNQKDLIHQLSNIIGLKEDAKHLKDVFGLIAKKEKQIIVIFDSLHYLSEKSIGGYDLFKETISYINELPENILLVNTYSLTSWSYLNDIFDIQNKYSDIVELNSISMDDMREIIESRNKVSGFNFYYPEIVQNSPWARVNNIKLPPERAKEYFYDLIYSQSNGNIYSALFNWLLCIQKISGSDIYLKLLPKITFSSLKALSNENILILLACLQQGRITAKNLIELLHIDEIEASSYITNLVNLKLLVKNGNYFFVNKAMYIAILNELKSRKFIYE